MRAERVVLTNDAVTSYLGAMFRAGRGGRRRHGRHGAGGRRGGDFARSDGWGYILGDEGSGYCVGRRGLASALRASDGRGGSWALLRRAEEIFGPSESIRDRVYGSVNPVGEVASFAREVAEVARGGDPEASRIWAEAAREVALTATSALGRVFAIKSPVSVSWTGALFDAIDLMLEPFKRHVAARWPEARLHGPEGTALRGAELLASSRSTPMFGSLVHVV